MLRGAKNLIKKMLRPGGRKRYLSALPPEDQDLISRIREKKLTYLSDRKLASLATACRAIENAKLPGIFIEAGCALGGSSILIASLKNARRPLFIYDVFGMIPPPTEEDTPEVHERYQTIVEGKSKGIDGEDYYGYQENLYEVVRTNLSGFGIDCQSQCVSLVKGMVQETLQIDEPVALAHIDLDWYDPVMTCLDRIIPRLTVGGCVILDDYHSWGGCQKACDEFFKDKAGEFDLDASARSMKITKK